MATIKPERRDNRTVYTVYIGGVATVSYHFLTEAMIACAELGLKWELVN